MLLFMIEIIIMILAIVLGLRTAGALGCGIFALVAQLVMVFGFGLPPGSAPVTAVLIILSIGIAGGTLQATGGIDYLVHLASKMIERFPKSIIFIAPMIVFVFVFGIGTTNIALSLEPIIAKTALKARIYPKKALTASVLTANIALLCSPAASATAYIISEFAGFGITMGQYLSIVLPTALLSMLMLSCFNTFIGRTKMDAQHAQTLLQQMAHQTDNGEKAYGKRVKLGVLMFVVAVGCILMFGIFPSIGPTFHIDGKTVQLQMTDLVQLLMYMSAMINILLTKVQPNQILTTHITQAAIGAIFAVLGPGWLGATIFSAPANRAMLESGTGQLVAQAPWLMMILIGCLAMIVISQSATASIVVPIVLSLGISPIYFIAIVQTLNVNFVIPAQPTILFAVDVDETHSTRITSFLLPGFFLIATTVVIGLLMKSILGV
ncbi:anaerobic C4-dicarboxylate transporter family protein [Staphylococcus lutrae]|uniref:C4-dicarboxylate ABC transporter n=1 Tax=Staphylococcus lutrae TaxID=155085 RepID=A0AAC9WJ68_9STAP|nr:anaerobic C4-dicarboxylate transporter family protein [Staphylococcus lutrae]ARJ50703.1 C4-dicarboxylate ABC transporter [Staphylococcus lutrae]PNZ34751.1 C4-dicarboxylate ABC transporter [Staphylococcus lutrae]